MGLTPKQIKFLEDHILRREIVLEPPRDEAAEQERQKAADAILQDLQTALGTLDPMCAQADQTALGTMADDIRAVLVGTPDDSALATAGPLLTAFQARIPRANENAENDRQARRDRKTHISELLHAVPVLDKGTPVEQDTRARMVAEVARILASDPPEQADLEAADHALAELVKYVKGIATEINGPRQKRIDAARVIQQQFHAISLVFPEPCPKDDSDALLAEQAALGALLESLANWAKPSEKNAEDLIGARARVVSLEKNAAALREQVEQAITARQARVDAVQTKAKALNDPEGAHQFDLETLKELRDDARLAPDLPLSDESAGHAEQALAELEIAFARLKTEIAGRAARVARAVDERTKLADPDRATKADLALIQPLRDHVDFSPILPLTEDEAVAAEVAMDALRVKVQLVTKEIFTREAARTEIDQRLTKIARSPHALPIEARDMLIKRRALRDKVAKADDLAAIKAIEADIKALEVEVSNTNKLFLARNGAQNALTAAQDEVKTYSSKINLPCYEKALADLAAVQSAQRAATSASDFDAVKVTAERLLKFLAPAADYHAYMVPWAYDTKLFVGAMTAKPDAEAKKKKAFEALRDRLLAEANALAAGGNPVVAKKKLGEFTTTEVTAGDGAKHKLDATSMDESKKFAVKLKGFSADMAPKLNAINRSKIPQPTPKFQPRYEDAKKKGWENGKWAEAEADLVILSKEIDICFRVAEKRLEYVNPAMDPDLEKAVVAMEVECKKGKYAAALVKLTKIDTPALKKKADYERRRLGMKKKVQHLIAVLEAPNKADIEAPWKKAKASTDIDEKLTELGKIDAILADILKWQRLDESLKVDALRADPKDSYLVLKAAKSLAGSQKYGAAVAALTTAKTNFSELARHIIRLDRLKALKAAIPPSETDIIKKVDTCVGAADIKAREFDWAAAQALVDGVLDDPNVQSRAAEIEAYQVRKIRTQALQKRLLAKMDHANAKAKIEKPMDAAVELAETNFKYTEAASLLDDHAKLLEQARTYVGIRVRTLKALASLDRAAKISATVSAGVYKPPNDKATLEKKKKVAEAEAAKGNFAGAQTLYSKILKDAQAGMTQAGKDLQTSDGGHYLAAHGPPPDVSEEKLKARILTGIRPDGKKVPANSSSQFSNIEGFLASREDAIEAATASGVDLGLTKLPIGTKKFEHIEVTETEVPVGKAYVSDNPKTEFRAGELKKSSVFENYREVEGLTRVFTKFVFVFADPFPKDGKSKKLLNKKEYKAHYAAVQAANKTGKPVPDMKEYLGRWVVHQHYPTPAGFDPDSGTYNDD